MRRIHSCYVLIGQTPVPEPDFEKWLRWRATADRVVKQTKIRGGMVSTVFLGMDYVCGFGPTPMLFETMVFQSGEGCVSEHCSTWLEAELQHEAVLQEWTEKLARDRKAESD